MEIQASHMAKYERCSTPGRGSKSESYFGMISDEMPAGNVSGQYMERSKKNEFTVKY